MVTLRTHVRSYQISRSLSEVLISDTDDMFGANDRFSILSDTIVDFCNCLFHHNLWISHCFRSWLPNLKSTDQLWSDFIFVTTQSSHILTLSFLLSTKVFIYFTHSICFCFWRTHFDVPLSLLSGYRDLSMMLASNVRIRLPLTVTVCPKY